MSTLDAMLPRRLLLDGGMGTALISRGLDVRETPTESWNLEHPARVLGVHRAFFAAGAGAVQTNTFGANRLRLETFGRQDDVAELNRRGAALAREAAPAGALVIGSMGPTGAIPPPEGNANLFELEAVFAEQSSHLARGGVDLIHIETLYHPKEARAAIRGCREGAPRVPVVASMTCKRRAGVYTTTMGFSPQLMLQVFIEERVDGVGVNCSLVPVELNSLVKKLVAASPVPVFAKPTIAPNGSAPLYPSEFANGVDVLFALGARAVGGCCGTGPADISAAREITSKTQAARL